MLNSFCGAARMHGKLHSRQADLLMKLTAMIIQTCHIILGYLCHMVITNVKVNVQEKGSRTVIVLSTLYTKSNFPCLWALYICETFF